MSDSNETLLSLLELFSSPNLDLNICCSNSPVEINKNLCRWKCIIKLLACIESSYRKCFCEHNSIVANLSTTSHDLFHFHKYCKSNALDFTEEVFSKTAAITVKLASVLENINILGLGSNSISSSSSNSVIIDSYIQVKVSAIKTILSLIRTVLPSNTSPSIVEKILKYEQLQVIINKCREVSSLLIGFFKMPHFENLADDSLENVSIIPTLSGDILAYSCINCDLSYLQKVINTLALSLNAQSFDFSTIFSANCICKLIISLLSQLEGISREVNPTQGFIDHTDEFKNVSIDIELTSLFKIFLRFFEDNVFRLPTQIKSDFHVQYQPVLVSTMKAFLTNELFIFDGSSSDNVSVQSFELSSVNEKYLQMASQIAEVIVDNIQHLIKSFMSSKISTLINAIEVLSRFCCIHTFLKSKCFHDMFQLMVNFYFLFRSICQSLVYFM